MIVDLLHYLGAAAMLLGSVFGLLAAVGVLRLPDLYSRLHAASKAGVVGAGLVLVAVALISAEGPVVLRAVLGIVFLLLSTPISAHLLARAAYKAGESPAVFTTIERIDSEEG